LQVTELELSPEQYLPPKAGVGLLQLLILTLEPPPHISLQLVQDVHGDHLPSVKMKLNDVREKLSF